MFNLIKETQRLIKAGDNPTHFLVIEGGNQKELIQLLENDTFISVNRNGLSHSLKVQWKLFETTDEYVVFYTSAKMYMDPAVNAYTREKLKNVVYRAMMMYKPMVITHPIVSGGILEYNPDIKEFEFR